MSGSDQMNAALDSSSGAPATASRQPREHARGVLERVGDVEPEHLRPELVEPQLERRDDAEVAAAAAQRPQQVGVLAGARADPAAVGQHDLGRDEVVDGHPVAPALVRDAAAEREAGDARLRHDAAGRREAERGGDAVDVGPRGAALHVHRAAGRVEPDAAHRGQVDHQAVVDERGARDVVAAAADGERQPVGRGEGDGGGDVAGVGAGARSAAGRLSIMPFQTRRAAS